MKKLNYNHMVITCFLGFICQAITINFAPLLFLTFSEEFSIPMSSITVLITANFGIQLLTDLFSPKFVDRIGYRASMLLANALCSAGLILLPILPSLFGGFIGLLIPTVIYAVGGGLLEVIVSPIIENCPIKKDGALSYLHSFYCWGVVLTVLVSTAYFSIFGVDNWRILSLLWAILPIVNIVLISLSPMPAVAHAEKGKSDLKTLFRGGTFGVFLLMMLASGASEMAIQQWASVFAESALGVDKTTGDLLGVCGFALMMATARVIYGKFSTKIPFKPSLTVCSLLTVICYLTIVFSKNSAIGFAACIVCGFSVGIFWPGTFAFAASTLPAATTSAFALLSLAGDVGCTLGPTVMGFVSDAFEGNFKMGILFASVFPMILVICILAMLKTKNTK